jgi:urease accessory protein
MAAHTTNPAQLLRLLHLADSALPIGATAHSFGLETLIQDGDVGLPLLERWFADYLHEAGTVDACYCRRAYRLGRTWEQLPLAAAQAVWRADNQELSALRPARESRTASHTLGGRLLRLLADLQPHPIWQAVLQVQGADTHYCAAFGLGGARLDLAEDDTVQALLRQNVAGLVSACQRLMPLGQGRAGQLLWRLHDMILAASAGGGHPEDFAGGALTTPSPFTALLDVGSMRHPQRSVRLFIS